MSPMDGIFSTGIPELDRVLCGIRPGDNIVWEVESIADYARLVKPFVETALEQGRRIRYFRFARHEPLVQPYEGVEVVHLDPQAGFETFLDGIHQVIEAAGRGAYHIFDSLSDLTADWYCDQMVGNFFLLTCPYLYELDTVAYFALLRRFHSSFATVPISQTAQIHLEVYHRGDKLYVHPLKVDDRSSPTMYLLHELDGETVRPVFESHTISEILTSSPRSALGLSQYHLGVWARTFVQAEALLEQVRAGIASPAAVQAMFERLLRMAISRDERVLKLAAKYFSLEDMVAIGKRLLGTGLIGGKSVGMLLARAILERAAPHWKDRLEVHDSFYIPSDVFYTFLVRNGCWKIRKRQLKSKDYLEGAEEARQLILAGTFPPYIEKRFEDMLDYFGQSPIIVRSSSLLEDNFGNSFAGKYESVFCANQGSREERLEKFMVAVKTVYASTMSKPALTYRARFNLIHRDEQMALLIQRVSGGQHGSFHFPQIAGVGYSFNPYVWDPNIDPKAGMLRLVFGLGTRAVDRSDDDYTRLVALNAPERRPGAESEDLTRHSQHKVDAIDLENNTLTTTDFSEVCEEARSVPVHLFATRDLRIERMARERGMRAVAPNVLTFDGLLKKTAFVEHMREMLSILEEAYETPVDIEFTANFISDDAYKLNLVQCRPLQIKGNGRELAPAAKIDPADLLLEVHGPVIGHSRLDAIDRIIYVVPSLYGQMPVKERYAVARLIGLLNHLTEQSDNPPITMLLGPGRWGTTTPSLGIPVNFSEINTVSVLCEIVAMREDLVPDCSFGTHFFSELVEMDMLYMALLPTHKGNFLNERFFKGTPSVLTRLVPEAEELEPIVRVIDVAELPSGRLVKIHADTLRQRLMCYLETPLPE
ncbi:MAG TPA: PEP/pyruvate-binding domain-containing protein [Candidatus Hydrogenedentes bacterium]|nr:PEP/pyruvate-binding domain-containing protein [Candidatus Hydrogenedentota bacterium]